MICEHVRMADRETAAPGIDLALWAEREGLTPGAVAVALSSRGESVSMSTVRRIMRGERWPDADMIERIVDLTGGDVTLFALHRKRAAWLRAHPPAALPVRTA